jgi:ubiquinone/menaquinone biosynthesis C-methylase UbiE
MTEQIDARVELQRDRAAELAARLEAWLAPVAGTESVLDAGCGTGAFAHAIAPLVARVVGVDQSEGFLAAARQGGPANCTFLEGDAAALPFGYGEFDLVGCLRVLHHVRRPELVVAELARVVRPGGRVLVVDQLGHVDPLRSLEADRFERERDPSHTRLLPDGDVRHLLDANDLVVTRNEVVREVRNVERFLDLVGLAGEERERIQRMAPAPEYEIEVGWYLATKPG